MNDYSQLVAQKLLQINAIKLSPQKPFTWASGIISPIYCDNRLTLSYPEVRSLVIDGFEALLKGLEFDVIAGIATAGIPHGALLADRLNKPFIYVRSKPKGHGRQNRIEGLLNEGAKVVMVEDLISTGMSSLAAVEAIRENGGNTNLVISIFNYGFKKAKDSFEAKKCNFASLSNYEKLLEEAVNSGYITPEDLKILTAWNKDPENWKYKQT